MNHIELEQELVRAGLDYSDHYSEKFKRQIKSSKVISREMTGVGFFTKYEIPNNLSIHKEMDGIWYLGIDLLLGPDKFPGACVLFIRKGLISTLEGWAIHGTWGDPLESYILTRNTQDEYTKFNEIEEWDQTLGFKT